MSSIILDGRALRLYPLGKSGFHGGTESYVRRLAVGLAGRGYETHVLTNDLEQMEHRGPNEFWWGPTACPTKADFWVGVHSLEFIPDMVWQHSILAANGVDPFLGPEDVWASRLSAVACFSECHVDLLTDQRPSIGRDVCKVTGLGVDTSEYDRGAAFDAAVARHESGEKFPLPHEHRFLYANDPARGLWHTLNIFDEIRREIPNAELRVAYDFDRQFENYRWQATALAEQMWLCKERIDRGDGVVNLGALSHEALVAEQLACDLHIYPSDPPNIGSQIHGLTQMEMAAAGVPLVLSDIEAFPEVFWSVATLLPVPGTLARASEDELARIGPEDWAAKALELMTDRDKWQAASERGRTLAAEHTWDRVIDRWDELLQGLPLD